MQPIKLTIEGDFWDVQIYRGRLYLFSMENEILTINWEDLIARVISGENLKLASLYTLVNGSHLYEIASRQLFLDKNFRDLMEEKLKTLSDSEIHLNMVDLSKSIIGAQDNPFDDFPIDSEIYNSKLYCSVGSGFWKTEVHKKEKNKYKIERKPDQIWDGSPLSIRANRYGKMALSYGSEGLFEYSTNLSSLYEDDFTEVDENLFHISKKHSSFSNWAGLSICSSSIVEESFISVFRWSNIYENFDGKPKLKFDKEISLNFSFPDDGRHENFLFWGAKNRIYKMFDNYIDIIDFNNYKKDEGEPYLNKLKTITLREWKGNVIEGKVAQFGSIIETDNSLVVIGSDNSTYTIPGPITRWRIYPRSRYYLTHLHVILEDRLEIFSFYEDSFLEYQNEKDFGFFYNSKDFE